MTDEQIEFRGWPKIPRGGQEKITIAEKIDGTNACIVIQDGGILGCQSRNRIITPEDDNFGFANWVKENEEDLLSLGDGYHYGEWAGEGIQKNPHGIVGKEFFLFNTFRWNENNPNRPKCCNVVPVLYYGVMTESIIVDTLEELTNKYEGDLHAEGVVVWYHNTKRYEKYTFAQPKWMS